MTIAWCQVALILFFSFAPLIHANPAGEDVAAGQASFDRAGSTLTINTSDRVIINWQDFSIGAGELTKFIQPSVSSVALNRVVSGNPSQIFGTLQANGQIFLINPNGILVGNGAVINTGGFTASTLDLDNSQFMAGGNLNFTGNSTARIENQGKINAIGGDIYLIARHIENSGELNAPDGTVGLAAGTEVLLSQAGEEKIFVKPSQSNDPVDGTGILNSGTIQAARAELKAHGNIYALAINNTGVIRANGVTSKNGHIFLTASGGEIRHSGTIAAKNADGKGGKVVMTADRVGVTDHAVIDASGQKGGGEIYIGGNKQGLGPIQNSKAIWIGQDVTISADALASGDGGTVILFADEAARIYGNISAKAGVAAGDGGFVETSGKQYFEILNAPDVTAANGTGGMWLIDPNNIAIVAGGGSVNMTAGPAFTTTNDSAQLGVTLITGFLNAGTSVTITTASAGPNTQAGDITVSAAIAKTAGGNASLTFTASGQVLISQAISSTVGTLDVTINAGTSVSFNNTVNTNGGNLSVTASGAVTQTAALTIAGTTSIITGANVITLNNAANNFGGAVSLTNSGANNVSLRDANALVLGTVGVGSGTLTIQSAGALTQTGAITQAAGGGAVSVTAGAGAITLTNAGNDFVGSVAISNSGANNVAITDTNAIVLGTVGVGTGTLNVTATGSITQTGVITQTAAAGAASFTAGANAITLNNAANNFIGAVSLSNSGANDVSIRDVNTLILGTVAVGSGTLTIQSTGAITQTAALTQEAAAGAASITAGAGAITLANAANDFTGAVSLSNSGANNVNIRDANALTLGTVGVGTGTLTVLTAGTITQTGVITQAAAAGVVSITAGANAITLDNAANNFIGAVSLSNSGVNDVSIRDVNALILGTVSVGANLTIQTNGAITQTAALTIPGNTIITAGAGAITLTNAANNFTGDVSLSNSGANNVSLTDINALQLGNVNVGTGTLTFSSVGISQAAGSTVIQTAGAGAVSVAAGAGVIILANANDFVGSVGLTNSGANNVSINDINSLTLGTVSVGTGTLTIVASGAITQTGSMIQAAAAGVVSIDAGANAITLNNAANNFIGAVSINNSGANNVSIRDANILPLGTVTVGSGTLTIQSAGAITQTGALTQTAGAGVASITAGAGAITLNNAANDFTGALSLSNSGANNVNIRDANALTLGTVGVGTGTLTVLAAGAITQIGAITQTAAAGVVSFTAGANAITLNNAANDFTGAVSLSNSGANDVSIRDVNALPLGTVAVGSGLLAIQSSGAITQTGPLTQTAGAGAVSVTAGAGAVTLNNAGNDFVGALSLSNSGANNVSIRDANALVLNTVSVGTGTLTVLTAGSITQTGVITQAAAAGAASFTAGANAITLANAANDFTGAVSLSNSGANDVSIRDASALALGVVGVGSGTLTIQASGAITQTGALTQAAGAGAVSVDAGANAITLANAANDFTGSLSLNNSGANNVSVRDANALVLGTVNVGSGTLGVLTVGAITQTGVITQAAGAGAVSIAAGAGAITLTNAANEFTGSVGLNNTGANNVSIRDATALDLGVSSVGTGTLTIVANGAITQTGSITQAAAAAAVSVDAGANAITLTNAANNFIGAVSLSNSGANDVSLRDANTLVLGTVNVGANLSIQSNGGITQTAALTIPGTTSVNAGTGSITLNNAANDFVGALSITNSGLNNVNIRDANSLELGTVNIGTGTFTVLTTGAITQSGSITQAAAAGAASFTAGANAITLSNAANDFTGAVSLSNSGANNVSLRDASALPLGIVAVGSGTLTIQSSGAITQTGALTQAAGAGAASIDAGAGAITLNNAANNFIGDLSLSNTGANNVNIRDLNALQFATVNIGSGTFTVLTAGAITQTGTITQAAGAGATSFTAGAFAITLNNAANDFTGAVSLSNSGANNVNIRDANALTFGTVGVGTGTLTILSAGAITQTGSMVQAAAAGVVSITAGANAITLSNAANDFTGVVSLSNSGANDVSLRDANALALGTVNIGANLTLQSNGAITQTVALTIPGTTTINAGAGAITLNNAANDFTGALSLSNSGANNINIRDANALILGPGSIGTGTLTVLSAGAITQTGGLTQAAAAGAASFTAGANAITLDNAANDFTGAVSLSNSGANDVSLRDASALVLGTVNIGANLTIQSNGAITQTVALTIPGTTTINAGAGAITLNNAANNFTGALSLSNSGANNINIRDANALILGTGSIGTGTLTILTAGAITQTGGLTQAAGAGAASFSAGANAITLSDAGNDFTGAVSLSNSGANNVSLRDANALTLGTVAVGSGTLTIQANGAITQTAALTQAAGAGVVSIDAGAGAITLTNAANDFIGALSLSNSGANDVSIRDANTLAFGTVNVGSGTLTIVGVGAITQTGAMTQAAGAGAASITAGAGAITLNNAGNDFTGALSLSNSGANNVNIRDANALAFGTVSVGTGTLTILTAGAITQTGSMVQAAAAGVVSITAGANAITLNNAGNDFTGAVSLSNSGANDVSIRDANALALGTVSVGSGTLTIQSNGAITQAAALTQAAGAGAATVTAGAGAITLNNAANDFTGALSLNNSGANNINIRDANALILGTGSIGTGTLTILSAGAITQTGGLTQAAGASAASFSAGANAITLSDAGNDFTGAVSLSNSGANNVSLRDANALTLGTVAVGSGTLTIQANGAITQTAALTQAAGAGAASIAAGATPITLTNAANDFTGVLSLSNSGANDVLIRDANALILGTSSLGQNLTLTTGGAITQTGSLTLSQLTLSAGGAITLNHAGNVITSLGSVSRGGAFSLNDSADGLIVNGPVNAGAINNAATIVTAGGDLTLNGVVSATGNGNDVTLVTDQNFINNAGAAALTTTGTGRYLVYSTNPVLNTDGGLPFSFQQYSTTYPTAPSAGNTGSGFLYSIGTPPTPGNNSSTASSLLEAFDSTAGRYYSDPFMPKKLETGGSISYEPPIASGPGTVKKKKKVLAQASSFTAFVGDSEKVYSFFEDPESIY